MMLSTNNIRDAAALHKEALDLRSFLTLQEFQANEKGLDEHRSPSPTNSIDDNRSGVVLFDPKDLSGTTKDRRRPFRLQLERPERDGDSDEERENQVSNGQIGTDDNNQTSHEQDEDTTRERLRNKVIAEICSTERSYVNAIRTLHDYYIVPLEDNKHPIMEDAQIAVFFNNLRQLVMLNSKLLNDLLDIVEKRGGVVPLSSPVFIKGNNRRGHASANSSPSAQSEGIGAVFCRYAPLFKLYGGYAKDYEEVAQLLQSYKRDSRLGFNNFLETCRARSGAEEGFESLLIKPIQRIPRYKLLLERICEYTPSGHRDEAFLKEAVCGVSFAASLINETVRNQENLETVIEAQKKFAGQLSLLTANRRLIRSGKLIKMSTKRHEDVILHLFNDILVYSGILITGGYRVRRVVQLNSKAVGVRIQIPSSHHQLFQNRNLRQDCGFVITSREKKFVLFASNAAERTTWVEAISSAIQEAQKHTEGVSTETAADAAALWVPDAVVGSCTVCHAGFKVYFRRHHCRRCGAVVCGNCSDRRSILFVGDSAREERVCTPCYKVLHLVKVAAFKWLSRVVEFKGVLRRKRWNKWSEHYFELKAGILKQYTLASANGLSSKCCTDTLDLTGAIVIHRSDERSQKNRFCFQISTSDFLDQDQSDSGITDDGQQLTNSSRGTLKKLSPLKAAVSRLGEGSRTRDSSSTLSSEGSFNNLSRQNNEAFGWVLCATSYQEEMTWSTAIQRSADKALHRARRSRVTECAFPVPFERINSMPSSLGSNILSDIDVFFDEASKMEHRRLQIMKEIIRSEESYVACLGECIRVFVQPLLLRQLESQKTMRRKQSKRKTSLLHSLSSGSSNALTAAAALAQRTVSSGNGSSLTTSMRRMAPSSTIESRSANAPGHGPKAFVLDADMAIFFSSIDQICTLNQQLLEHLSRHLEDTKLDTDDDGVYRPGAIFSAYAPLFQLYTSYASRHEAALNAIESQQFVGFLKEMPEEASVNRLRTYLNMPMERIPRYKVFLQELLESTSHEHIDYAPLQAAITSVNQVANKVQEIIARRASAKKVEEIGSRVGIDLRGKRFVMEGMLKKVCRSKVQKYYFVLLEDALVYGRMATGLQKKKFRLIELSECKVSDDTDSIPRAVNAVTGCSASHNAFYFFSPLKSFILVAISEEDKAQWMTRIQESIDRTLRGPRSSRRASIRSELLLDEEDQHEYELESAFVIKNGWLNVMGEETKRNRRMWITLNMQAISLATMFKGAQPEENISIGLCEAVPMKEPTFFRLYVRTESTSVHAVDRQAYTFEAQNPAEREEWLRALNHCISGSSVTNIVEMRRRSLNSATHAPIFMFNKVSSVCMICYQSFAVYRPRHHCRLCGSLVCGNCSKKKWTLSYGSSKKASRICDGCAEAAISTASSLVSEF